ncbi:hypothetical protein Fmac_031506 [Flemingia macrophylla]|uniref:Uncharacterized protein n=1 Tax=Flemingia macrophylla TaxID=520843 RepID=A0ABD1L3L2_9FABA
MRVEGNDFLGGGSNYFWFVLMVPKSGQVTYIFSVKNERVGNFQHNEISSDGELKPWRSRWKTI